MIALKITCRGFSLTPELRAYVQKYADNLQHFSPRVQRCEVAMSSPHRHQRKGRIYHVSIRVEVPGQDLVVSRESEEDFSHENLRLAIHDAFRALERRLEDQVRILRRDIKTLAERPEGHVTKVFPELNHGFLETREGREIYFHRNSLKGMSLNRLKVGTRVHFRVEEGKEGPQATYVRTARKIRRQSSEAA